MQMLEVEIDVQLRDIETVLPTAGMGQTFSP
jgi:hypothetical protein